jgi:hypothetical protein
MVIPPHQKASQKIGGTDLRELLYIDRMLCGVRNAVEATPTHFFL